MAVRKKMMPEISMVDITPKKSVHRIAVAEGSISLSGRSIRAIREGSAKGDVLAVAEIAGISAAKRTSELIPLCHQIPLNVVDVKLRIKGGGVSCACRVEADWKTGVEMEALTAVSVALLTVWDMVKKTEKDEGGQYPSTLISGISVVRKKKVG